MTFIDKALNECNNGEDFCQALSDIYNYNDVREQLSNYPEWVQYLIVLLDFDTELQMDGLDFKSYEDVVKAMEECCLYKDASYISKLKSDPDDNIIEEVYSNLYLNNGTFEEYWNSIFDYADRKLKEYNNNL